MEERLLLALLHEKLDRILWSDFLDSSNVTNAQERKNHRKFIKLIEEAKGLLETILPEKDARIIQKEFYMSMEKSRKDGKKLLEKLLHKKGRR